MRDQRLSSWTIILVTTATVLGAVLVSTQSRQPAPFAVSAVLTQALMDRDSLPPAEGSLWRFEGPSNLQKGSHSFGEPPYSGRINEVAVYAADPRIMYATGASGGVWKTTDGGQQWASRSSGPTVVDGIQRAGWSIQTATAVAVDPTDPNRVFVGTGDYKRVDHVPPFSVGIMRSLDGGLTWQQLGTQEMRYYTVSRIVIDPANPQNVLAATGRGSHLPGGHIFRSSDGGATWSSVTNSHGVSLPDANWDDLEACSQNFWAGATGGHNLDFPTGNAQLYRSPDGITWTKVALTTATFDLDSALSPDTVQIACSNTGLRNDVFVAVYMAAGGARVFATVDTTGVPSWNEVTSSPVDIGTSPWAHAALGMTTTRLYLGGVDIVAAVLPPAGSPIGTLSFTAGAGGQSGHRAHSDLQCAVPDPTDPTDPDAVFLCTDGGLYRFSAQANTATSLNSTLGVTQVYRMDVHPRHGGLIGIGLQDLGDAVSFYGNGNDAAALRQPPTWALVLGGDGRSAAFRGDDTSHVYLSQTYGEVARYDGSVIANTPNNQTDLLAPAVNSQGPLLYQRSVDRLGYADTSFHALAYPDTEDATTAQWTTVPIGGTVVQSLVACPTNALVIYAGSTVGDLFGSEDGGGSWTPLDTAGLPLAPIWTISPSPTNCHDVLVGAGYDASPIHSGNDRFYVDRLFKKQDISVPSVAWDSSVQGGPAVLPHAPVFAIVRHPAAPDSTWFVAGDVGVFRTDDGGSTWTNATGPLGLPNTLVRDLRISADGNTLYAGTFGRGVWSMDVSRPAADVFGVRGTATTEGRPLAGVAVVVEGSGRIRKWLKNTITDGTVVTTAPIDVTEFATISRARAFLTAFNVQSVSLLPPSGPELPMTSNDTGKLRSYSLTTHAPALVGQQSRGSWRFKVVGMTAAPSIKSANVDFEFTDRVSNVTGPDGEYTIEYLQAGSHVVSIFDCDCSPISFNLSSAQTNLDFALNPPVSIVATTPIASESGAVGRFTVSRIGSTSNPLTVSYVVGGTATNGVDYKTLNGSVTIPAGSASAPITVSPANDTLNEDTETVVLQLVPGHGYGISDRSTATVQILDNDPLPVLTINNVSVLEGGTSVFTVTLSPASGKTVTVDFATSDGTARALASTCLPLTDYLSRSGARSFAPGITTQTISVPTCADLIPEGSETFLVTLSHPSNAVFQTKGSIVGTATIVEGATLPTVGTFLLAPTDAVVSVNEPVTYTFIWTVPEPRNWRTLKTLDFRIRHGHDSILWVRFDEATNTFAIFDEDEGRFGQGVAPGSAESLETEEAILHVKDARVVGSGPTGPSVTLNLPVSLKREADERAYVVEVAATDDLGNRDAFVQAGTLTRTHSQRR